MKLSEGLELLYNKLYLIEEYRHISGLCALASRVFWVFEKDYKKVNKYINSNIPINRIWFKLWNGGYWWEPGLVEPRKKWLEKHIKKLKAKGL